MRFFINEEIIEGRDAHAWAHQIVKGTAEEWQCDVARTIISYYDTSNSMTLSTSGSTGTPKVIRHSKESIRQSARKTGRKFDLKPGMTSFNCLPSKYIAGMMMIIRAIVLNMDQVLVAPKARLDPDFPLTIDFAAMIPMQVNYLLNNHYDFLNAINCLIIGGAPISPTLRSQIAPLDASCYATYGMTETITHVAAAPLNRIVGLPVFEALDGVRFEEKDAHLVICADHLDQPRIITTDIVELIDRTHFRWLGRSDHVINSGGVKVHPELLEEKLAVHIDDPFFVSSLPDIVTGEKVIILIEAPAYTSHKLEPLKVLIDNLPSGEQPRQFFFIPRFKRTTTGKIQRNLNLYQL